MVKLRLTRAGAKKHPIYHVVATDSRSPRDGRFIERLGFYDPGQEPVAIRLDGMRLEHWLGVGAQPTETVKRLISTWRRAQPAA